MKKTIMKKSLLALCALTALSTLSFAQSITVGSASGSAGGAAAPVPIAIVFAQNAAPTAANTVRDIDVRLTYNAAFLTITAAGAAPGNCQVTTPGTIVVSVADTGNPIVGGTICNLTAITIGAAAPAGPIALTVGKGGVGVGSGCANAVGGNANCTYINGAVTVGGVPPATAPTVSPLTTPVTLAGAGTAVGSVPVNVATAGTVGGSLALACTIPATGASAFAITAGNNRTIAGPAALGANPPAIGLSCVPGVAAVSATLTCAQTPTPAAALPPLTSTVTCPAIGGVTPTITPNILGGTAATPTTLTIANSNVPPQPVGAAVNITGLAVTGAGFVAPATGSWGACIFSADATPPANTTSDPTAFTPGPQLVFNAANNGVAQPQIVSATRRATQVSAIVTCPVLPAGILPASTANVYRLVLAAGAGGAITAVTPPGAVVLPGYTLPAGSSSTTLTFNITSANGALACVPTGTGYTATPNPLNLVVGTPGSVTVTYTGAAAGTFAGTLTCTAVAPATGGPFVYTLSTTVAPAAVVGVVTAVTPSGAVTLPGYTLPTGSSSTTLTFNITGVNGQIACVPTGTGYTATPNPQSLVVGTPGSVTVTYTGNAAGTFAGTLVCTPVAPATGGPFTYTLSTVVSPAIVINNVQVPALGNISLMLLVAGFLGLGMVLVGRRQA